MAIPGQDYVCPGCHVAGRYPDDVDERHDRYGIYAGCWHDTCWDRDGYGDFVFDPTYAGESLDDPG